MYFNIYFTISEICNNENINSENKERRLTTALQLLVLLLPENNRILLKKIIDLLNKVIQYEDHNKMNATSLSTLFSPHLICPRKLSPELLHTTSQKLSSIITFAIKSGSKIFNIPIRLATDIEAYLVDKQRKVVTTPELVLNDSISGDSTANTIYTFVDREKTAAAHDSNTTNTALAELYAHIQSLPESSRKRKLIKQFNKENGYGQGEHIMQFLFFKISIE